MTNWMIGCAANGVKHEDVFAQPKNADVDF
jgi:hypothetical protein